ncbi:methionine aminopeptidase 1D, mitochondrial-like [Uloborus diversus]|uniref:methionine aminopeptidase 1D, mitochondrial-like n=1 Tax=Uloborus diversus TaxID=327109 RepID=UPI0024091DF8|nr:methionine aminopeptidase 1D, mitochondrial-like [Uloborus diversus]
MSCIQNLFLLVRGRSSCLLGLSSSFRIQNATNFQVTTPKTLLKDGNNYIIHRNFSRKSKFWFQRRKPKYDVVSLSEVSPRREIPDYIVKPDYADSGVASEHDEIEILTNDKQKNMRQSCALAKLVLDEVSRHIDIGVTTDDLDHIAHSTCISYGAYPSPLNYRGFPKSICTSVNNIACHGIPDSRKLRDGDVISIDVSVYYNGFHGDCAATYCVGNVDANGQHLLQVASSCLNEAIKLCHHNQYFKQIGKTISELAKQDGYTVVLAFCGHGIGSCFHTPPNILHYDNDVDGQMLKGMIFTIEPVICEGQSDILILEDGWTAATEDDSRCAQFEHTILITDNGAEILTLSDAFQNVP